MRYSEPDYKIIGKNIRALRNEKEGGLKQQDLADSLGITVQFVSKWERGEKISFENLYAIAQFFNVSIDYLMGRSKYKTMDRDAVGKMTGLSPKAVDVLCGEVDFSQHSLHSKPLGRYTIEEFESTDFINKLIESEEYEPISNKFIELCECTLGLKLASKNVQIRPLDRYEEMPLVEKRTQDGELHSVCFDTSKQFDQKELYEGLIGKGMWDLNEKIISLINSAIETRVPEDLVNSKVSRAQMGEGAKKNRELQKKAMNGIEEI